MRIALLGLGVVGSGTYNQLIENKEKIEKETGLTFEVVYGLAKEITPKIEQQFNLINLTENVEDILNDDTIDCIVEVMGTVDFAYDVIKRALNAKKHVVSANKDLIAIHGYELMKLAKQNGCDFYFEASVAGGIPILRSITKGLASDNLYDIKGILNGTSNYILTKMSKEGLTYEEALKQAQELGFAEADPTSDVAGYDAARKVAILALLGYHVDAKITDVECIGIENVSTKDIELANSLGYEIKLIGHSCYQDGKISLSVAPTFVSTDHQLASVNNEMNAIYVCGEAIGDLMLYGAGAGSNPTGVAVMSDILEVARNMSCKCNARDIVLPYKDMEINNDTIVEKYIIVTNNSEIKNIVTPFECTNEFVIAELTLKEVKDIVAKYNTHAYKMLNS